MCWILQKWFYICICVKQVLQIYNKIIVSSYNYYKKGNYGKILYLFLPFARGYFPCDVFSDCVDISGYIRHLFRYRHNDDGDQRTLAGVLHIRIVLPAFTGIFLCPDSRDYLHH
jgi:hypothetical protein